MEAAQTNVESPNFETIWAILREVAASQKETDRIIKETTASQKETDKQLKETDRITRENAKYIGKMGHDFGDIAEHLVAPNLAEKFNELGFVFDKTYRNTEIKGKNNNISTEIDVTLENGDKVMIVEVKTKLTTEDIKDHIERMNKVRAHADKNGDKRQYLGAVAGVVMTDYERAFAFKCGFYVIEPSGETFVIRKPEGIYSIKEW
jgi:Holliday junction resolvase-like predicted endonuclease